MVLRKVCIYFILTTITTTSTLQMYIIEWWKEMRSFQVNITTNYLSVTIYWPKATKLMFALLIQYECSLFDLSTTLWIWRAALDRSIQSDLGMLLYSSWICPRLEQYRRHLFIVSHKALIEITHYFACKYCMSPGMVPEAMSMLCVGAGLYVMNCCMYCGSSTMYRVSGMDDIWIGRTRVNSCSWPDICRSSNTLCWHNKLL